MVHTEKNKRFLELAKEQYGNDVEKIFDYSEVEFVRMRQPVMVRCIKHNSKFAQCAGSHLSGSVCCKQCRKERPIRKKVRNTKEVIELGKKIHNNLDTYERTNYINSKTKIIITCKKHGDYEIFTPKYLIGSRCAVCGVEGKQLPLTELKAKVVEVHGGKYTYNWDTYKKSSSKMKIQCPVHGWFEQRVNTHIGGAGCRECGVNSRRYTSSEVLAKINSYFRDRYTYDKFNYIRDGDPVIITCKTHGDFSKVPNELVRGYGCTKCTDSRNERNMCNILDDNNIAYIQEYKFRGSNYRYDMYLPKLNILIELDGLQHYKPVEHFGGEAAFAKRVGGDINKNELAKKLNISLIRIPYTEFGILERAFFSRLRRLYKYLINGIYYKSFKDLPIGTVLPSTTTVLDVKKYKV